MKTTLQKESVTKNTHMVTMEWIEDWYNQNYAGLELDDHGTIEPEWKGKTFEEREKFIEFVRKEVEIWNEGDESNEWIWCAGKNNK